MSTVGFSIVVCTFNGKSRLGKTLEHLSIIKIPECLPCELIVIDNASTDNTKEFILQEWGVLGWPYNLKIINEAKPGKANALERGYDNAKYELIVTVDDDNWLCKDYLIYAYQQYLKIPSLILLGGRSTAEFEEELPSWVADVLHHNAIGAQQSFSGRMDGSNNLLWGAGMVLKNSFWKKLRNAGFYFLTSRQTGKAIGEDTELSIAAILAGNERYYCDEMLFTHFMPKGRFEWRRTLLQFKGFGSTHIVFDAYHYIFHCIQHDKKPSDYFFLSMFFKKIKKLKNFTLKQWLFYLFIKPEGEYYILKQNMLLSELKHSVGFYKVQSSVFASLYNWQVKLFKHER